MPKNDIGMHHDNPGHCSANDTEYAPLAAHAPDTDGEQAQHRCIHKDAFATTQKLAVDASGNHAPIDGVALLATVVARAEQITAGEYVVAEKAESSDSCATAPGNQFAPVAVK